MCSNMTQIYKYSVVYLCNFNKYDIYYSSRNNILLIFDTGIFDHFWKYNSGTKDKLTFQSKL